MYVRFSLSKQLNDSIPLQQITIFIRTYASSALFEIFWKCDLGY